LIALDEAFRQGWERFLYPKPDEDDVKRDYLFAELLNTMEIACGLDHDKVFIGAPRELLSDYLDDIFLLINNNAYAIKTAEGLIHSKTTFKYLGIYLYKFKSERLNNL
jgi:hypothetical protein